MGMFSWIGFLLAATAAPSPPSVMARPDPAAVAAAERAIGTELAWPAQAGSIANFDRHYFRNERDPTLLRAQFRKARRLGAGRLLLDKDAAGLVFDGGCGVVNLSFYGPGDPRDRLLCGGR